MVFDSTYMDRKNDRQKIVIVSKCIYQRNDTKYKTQEITTHTTKRQSFAFRKEERREKKGKKRNEKQKTKKKKND